MKNKRVDSNGIRTFTALHFSRASVWVFVLLSLTAAILVRAPGLCAQQEGTRKVRKEVQPQFPPLARRMGLAGTVRVSVAVTPEGKVKSAHALGGHPLFIAAAEEAAKKCEYETGSKETNEVLEFHFEKEGT